MPPDSPTYEGQMPNSWHLFTSRVDANQPTAQERETAHRLIRTGWFSHTASTYDRNQARKEFQDGMRYGFKDRYYQVNWTVWRSEYRGRNYPPGSFDPKNPPPDISQPVPGEDPLQPYIDDPRRPRWMSPERWRDELERQAQRDERREKRQYKQFGKGNVGEQMRPEDHPFYNPKPEPSPWEPKERPRGYWRPKLGFPWIKHVKPDEEDM